MQVTNSAGSSKKDVGEHYWDHGASSISGISCHQHHHRNHHHHHAYLPTPAPASLEPASWHHYAYLPTPGGRVALSWAPTTESHWDPGCHQFNVGELSYLGSCDHDGNNDDHDDDDHSWRLASWWTSLFKRITKMGVSGDRHDHILKIQLVKKTYSSIFPFIVMSAAPWFILIAFLKVTFLSLNKPEKSKQ